MYIHMCSISLRVFLLKHLQSQGHLLCWYMLFSEKTRFLQEGGNSPIFLVSVSTTEDLIIVTEKKKKREGKDRREERGNEEKGGD